MFQHAVQLEVANTTLDDLSWKAADVSFKDDTGSQPSIFVGLHSHPRDCRPTTIDSEPAQCLARPLTVSQIKPIQERMTRSHHGWSHLAGLNRVKVGNGWIGRSLGFVLARRAPFLGIFSLIFETFFYMLFEYEDGVFPYLY